MDTKRVFILLLFFFLLFPLAVAEVWGLEELSDQKLNAVTAGSSDAAQGSTEALSRIPLNYSGRKGSVAGEVLVLPAASFANQGTLMLSDNAQSNLRSLINVNAVNSPVQVLLNLNVSINSTIGNINQLNHLLSDQGSWR